MKNVKSKNVIKFGLWVVLISALVISLFLFPNFEYITFSVLIILAIFGLAKLRERIMVRNKLTPEQIANVALHTHSMQ